MFKNWLKDFTGETDDWISSVSNQPNKGKCKIAAQIKLSELLEKVEKNAVVSNGIIRWKDSNECLDDCSCKMLDYINYDFDIIKTTKARELEKNKTTKTKKKIEKE